MLDLSAVGALRPDQPRATRLLLAIAGEGVGAERPAERDPGRVAALGQRRDPVAAFRQGVGQPGEGPHRRLALGETDQHSAEPSLGIGDQRQLAGVARKPGRRDPIALGRRRRLAPRREARFRYRDKRHRAGIVVD